VAAADSMNRAPWTAEGQEKRDAVRRMFADIAPTYDRCNALMSLSLHKRWRSYAVSQLGLEPGETALDLCCGTGDFLQPLQRAVGGGGKVLGIDFCLPMLQLAKAKSSPGITSLGLGDACRLPVRSMSVDAVTVGWGIRNVPDIDAAHREIARALRPGGKFVSLDMARPRNPVLRRLSEFMFNIMVPRLGALFGKREAYTYLPKSTEKFWSREELAESMRRAGMVDVTFQDLFFGNICVHSGRKAEGRGEEK